MTWKLVKLGDVCHLQNGFAFKSNLFKHKGLPILRISNIQNEHIDTRRPVYFNATDYNVDLKKYEVKTGDLLIAMSGATTGKIGFNESPTTFYLNQRVGKLVPGKDLEIKYLYYLLSSKVEENLKISKGAAQPNLSSEQIKNIEISLPPIQEQQRIVSKLEAAFSEIDNAITNSKKTLSDIKHLNNKFFDKLLGKNKCQNIFLNDICKVERGSSPRPIKSFLTEKENGINWIKISDTKQDGKYISSTKQKITKDGAKKSKNVKKGDFVLTNSMSYGRPYIMSIDGCIHDGWFLLRLQDDIDKEYFYYLLSSSSVQNQFKSLAAGSVVKNISGDLVKKTMLLIPSKKIQIEIKEKLSIIDKYIQKISTLSLLKINNYQKLKLSILNNLINLDTKGI
jgi:type I restriction enzyme, S subunit